MLFQFWDEIVFFELQNVHITPALQAISVNVIWLNYISLISRIIFKEAKCYKGIECQAK